MFNSIKTAKIKIQFRAANELICQVYVSKQNIICQRDIPFFNVRLVSILKNITVVGILRQKSVENGFLGNSEFGVT